MDIARYRPEVRPHGNKLRPGVIQELYPDY